jgi:hypothetical protein
MKPKIDVNFGVSQEEGKKGGRGGGGMIFRLILRPLDLFEESCQTEKN